MTTTIVSKSLGGEWQLKEEVCRGEIGVQNGREVDKSAYVLVEIGATYI